MGENRMGAGNRRVCLQGQALLHGQGRDKWTRCGPIIIKRHVENAVAGSRLLP